MTFRFVAVLVGRKCFAITRVLGFLCDVLLCLLYSDVQKSLRFPLMATKGPGGGSGCRSNVRGAGLPLSHLRQSSFGFPSQLFSSLTKLMGRNSF